jgi:uncharacterized protein
LIYLDSCALVKLVVNEVESDALDTHLAQENLRGTPLISSEIIHAEVRRALIRIRVDQHTQTEADAMLDAYAKLPVPSALLVAAGRLPYQHLGTLDAIHLASAVSLGKALTQFITYDKQLGKVAAQAGLPVHAPGA